METDRVSAWKSIAARCVRGALAALALLPLPATAPPAEAATDSWFGTWNAPNLWRCVELHVAPEKPDNGLFRVGTAGERLPVVARRFWMSDTALSAELDYAGTRVTLDGHMAGGIAEGPLTVARGGKVLSQGRWRLERRAVADLTADDLMRRVRDAVHLAPAPGAGYVIEASTVPPEGEAAAPVQAWSARVGSRGEIAVSEDGEATLLFDGARVWLKRTPFGWMPAEARMQEKVLLAESIRSGAWLMEGAPLERSVWISGAGDDRRYVLELRTKAGIVAARVVIDPRTWRPESAAVAWDAGDRTFRFADYVELGGGLIPGRVTSGYKGREQTWKTTRVAPEGGVFGPPPFEGIDYDRTASAVMAGTRGSDEDGHLFVRPLVDGREMGWFHVDTGAPFMILDTAVADELGLPVVRAMGARTVRRVPEFRVGQLILKDRLVLVQDLSGFTAPDSSRRAGVLGGPVFEAAVVEFDYSGKRLSVYAPTGFPESVSDWQSLSVEGAPVIEASFDGRAGRFIIDTGKSGAVSFVSHAAARRGLYQGRELEEAENRTVEGATIELVTRMRTASVGGQRIEQPEIRIKLPGTTNDEIGTTDGIIGRALFGDRRVVFDYAGRRIAFLKTER